MRNASRSRACCRTCKRRVDSSSARCCVHCRRRPRCSPSNTRCSWRAVRCSTSQNTLPTRDAPTHCVASGGVRWSRPSCARAPQKVSCSALCIVIVSLASFLPPHVIDAAEYFALLLESRSRDVVVSLLIRDSRQKVTFCLRLAIVPRAPLALTVYVCRIPTRNASRSSVRRRSCSSRRHSVAPS